MRLINFVIAMVIIGSLLVGCANLGKSEKKEMVNVRISGDVGYMIVQGKVFIRGESNLEPGTILTLKIEGEEFEKDIEVLPKGYFRTIFPRDNKKQAQLVLQLDPQKQSKEIKDIYGEHGEYLQGISIEYEDNGETYKTIESYAWLSVEQTNFWDQRGDPYEILFSDKK
ncbi:hypothetical protein [Bacillus suaedaesalsae]|uniref:Lipoprotein n=1 Tax=Bacillus suaedaesalsae TaxID=2810349 RepID=A0ABS2DHJ4_9BACI|nr:hypothetical protein [Bacillus suaedaesalsae]MBM6617928.1 hypothetical protein [Bacillus suaedaesalsae]